MVLKIRKYGDKVLRETSTPVEKIDEEILKILDDMVDTMKDAQGVGLAAPQVGVNKNMCYQIDYLNYFKSQNLKL